MYVKVDKQSVFYSTGKREPDPSQPNIVFIHGVSLDSTTWVLYTRYYARRGYNAYAFDLPGHGHSQGDPLPTMEDMADWLLKFLDAVGIESTTLVGHSMGGLIAMEAAVRKPERVERLVLLGVALPMPVAPVFLDAARKNEPAAIDMFVLWGYDFAAQIGGNLVPGISMLNSGRRLVERASDGVMYAGLNACNEYAPDAAHFDPIDCPTTMIIGHDDVMTPYKRALKFVASLAISPQVLDIADCGHMLILERPEEVHLRLLTAVKG